MRERSAALGIISIACPILVMVFVKQVFYSGPIQGSGESGLIGIAAAGFLCLFGLAVGLAAGLISYYRKEPRRLALAGVAANLLTAAILVGLLRAVDL